MALHKISIPWYPSTWCALQIDVVIVFIHEVRGADQDGCLVKAATKNGHCISPMMSAQPFNFRQSLKFKSGCKLSCACMMVLMFVSESMKNSFKGCSDFLRLEPKNVMVTRSCWPAAQSPQPTARKARRART